MQYPFFVLVVAFCLCTMASICAGVSPDFDENAYTLLSDSATMRGYFTSWALYHNRSYPSNEFLYRYSVWRDNYAFVQHFNANANATFIVGMNNFGDMTLEEIGSYRTGFVPIAPPAERQPAYEEAEEAAKRQMAERSIPSSWDWRQHNAVTPVRDQGSCGDCYAFSSIAAIEGAVAVSTSTLTYLSDQFVRTSSILA